jgi:hypothetical protein
MSVARVEPAPTAAAPEPAKPQLVELPALPAVEVKAEVPSLPPLPVELPKVVLPVTVP